MSASVWALASIVAGLSLVVADRAVRRSGSHVSARLLEVAPEPSHEVAASSSRVHRLWAPLGSATRHLVGLLGRFGPEPVRQGLERQLVLAGLSRSIEADDVVAAQLVGAGAGALAVGALRAADLIEGRMVGLALVACVAAGALVPATLLRRRAARRQQELRAALSDALDLLVLCLEAGQGFDAAIATVGEAVPGPLGAELDRVIGEMALGLSRVEALEGMAARNDSPGLSALVLALQQADEHGAPVAGVLGVQAAEARTRRRQELQEEAAKLPVRMLIPTALLIFPATFVVLLGPAVASMRGVFG